MISSLEIHNFQSHEKTELEFSPGVNVIIGSSDGGKTAIIRAMRWLIWNRPNGDSIRSRWGGETSVTLRTEDGSIIRSKDKIDSYLLVTAEGEEFTFKAFGTSIPEEIQNFLNINEINLQRQLDAPFLFSETPGAIAQHFNKIAKLDKIDIGTQNVNSWIRDLTSTIGVEAKKDKPATGLIKKIADTELDLSKYDYLEKAEVDLEILEGMQDQLRRLSNQLNGIQLLYYDYCETSQFIDSYKAVINSEHKIDLLLGLINEQKELDKESEDLENRVEQILAIQNEIKECEEIIAAEKDIKILISLYQEFNEVEQYEADFGALINYAKNTKQGLEIEEKKYSIRLAQFEKAFPDICPLCDQPVKLHKHD